jgi:hypothetical protein
VTLFIDPDVLLVLNTLPWLNIITVNTPITTDSVILPSLILLGCVFMISCCVVRSLSKLEKSRWVNSCVSYIISSLNVVRQVCELACCQLMIFKLLCTMIDQPFAFYMTAWCHTLAIYYMIDNFYGNSMSSAQNIN